MIPQKVIGPKLDWRGHKVTVMAPITTNFAEILQPASVLITTGEFNSTGRFMCVNLVFRYKRGKGYIQCWIRTADFLNSQTARPLTSETERQSSVSEAMRVIEGFKPIQR